MKSELHQLTHKKICQKIFQNYTRVSIPCNIDFKASKKNPIQEFNPILLKSLSQFNKTQEFCIKISKQNEQNNISTIFSSLKYLPKRQINSLSLSLNVMELSNLNIEQLGKCISHLANLKKIRLELQNNQFEAKSLEKISYNFKNFKNLEVLQLQVNHNQLRIEGMKHISDILTCIPKLKLLEIQAYYCQFNEECMVLFGESVAKLKNLETLQLGFGGNRLGSGFKSLCKGIQQLDKLEKFNLGLWSSRIEAEQLEHLNAYFSKRSSLLKEVEFSLSEIDEFNAQNIDSLSNGVSKMGNLECLSVDLGYILNLQELPRQFVENLFIEKEKLKKFELNLGGLKLKEEEVKFFMEKIKQVKQVQSIKLSLTQTGIVIESVFEILEGLKSFGQLKELHVDVSENGFSQDANKLVQEKVDLLDVECKTVKVNSR